MAKSVKHPKNIGLSLRPKGHSLHFKRPSFERM
jgi:hypothetical protein